MSMSKVNKTLLKQIERIRKIPTSDSNVREVNIFLKRLQTLLNKAGQIKLFQKQVCFNTQGQLQRYERFHLARETEDIENFTGSHYGRASDLVSWHTKSSAYTILVATGQCVSLTRSFSFKLFERNLQLDDGSEGMSEKKQLVDDFERRLLPWHSQVLIVSKYNIFIMDSNHPYNNVSSLNQLHFGERIRHILKICKISRKLKIFIGREAKGLNVNSQCQFYCCSFLKNFALNSVASGSVNPLNIPGLVYTQIRR